MQANLHKERVEFAVSQWLENLPHGHCQVIRRRLGLDGRGVACREAVARDLGIDGEQVRQYEARALERLARALRKLEPGHPGEGKIRQAAIQGEGRERERERGREARRQARGTPPRTAPAEERALAASDGGRP